MMVIKSGCLLAAQELTDVLLAMAPATKRVSGLVYRTILSEAGGKMSYYEGSARRISLCLGQIWIYIGYKYRCFKLDTDPFLYNLS